MNEAFKYSTFFILLSAVYVAPTMSPALGLTLSAVNMVTALVFFIVGIKKSK